MAGDVITLKEVAEFLKVHERTVYRLAAKGEIPAFKVANSWRFRRQDIERWIDQQTHSAMPRSSHEAD
ncbi:MULTISPECIES: helix-turn-helix domain-containing protein [unclassified Marinimicrobium]|uniref:helix-turn-helix domain-containing protein n=1 Tax=Marinimicrobium TaxID=359337 RepID=UPI000C3F1E1F|nr:MULTISPECIES: helix-turn-helix domain-containing protein [unclassified Marinimicrobium]MAN53113.1 transcriptional regulator [Marinimicrobium sp.]